MFCCNSHAKISSISQYCEVCCVQRQCGREKHGVSWHSVAPVTSCIYRKPLDWEPRGLSISQAVLPLLKETITLCVSQALFNLLAQSQSRGSEVKGLRETNMSRDHPHRHRGVASRDADLE